MNKLATEIQNKASNPTISAWVDASAGTGKTKVLTDRILKILLYGGDISKILCITYTKNSANEMLNRLIETSKKWAMMNDEKLKCELGNILEDEYINDELILKARTLFAVVCENIESIKIKTIHSFCEEILKKFPVEAGINPHFKNIPENERKAFLKNVINEIFKQNDVQVLDQISYLASFINQDAFGDIQKDIISNANKFEELFKTDFKTIDNKLRKTLEIKETDLDKIKLDFIKNHIGLFNGFVNISSALSETAKKYGRELSEFLLLNDIDKIRNFNSVVSIFLTGDKTVRKTPKEDNFQNLANKVFEFYKVFVNINVYNQSKAVLIIAKKFLDQYKQEKEKQGLLDFDDLISKTLALLTKKDISSWVIYKMNGGISHILLDEAQDTSPYQWKIIDAISENFFETNPRNFAEFKSIFIVGDRKQSIYSFQGADVENFEKYFKYLEDKIDNSDYKFKKVDMNVSFRSSETVLNFVDEVFKKDEILKGVSLDKVKHINGKELNGRVELYPHIKLNEKVKKDYIEGHFDEKFYENNYLNLAKAIAIKIRNLLDSKIYLADQKRYLSEQDIIILVKSRNRIVSYLNKELKNLDIEFEGIDKFKLLDDMATEDLLACGKFAVFPFDDLNLAGLFKSPLIGGSEKELFDLCYGRGGESLWDRILNSSDVEIAKKRTKLQKIYEHRNDTPFEFYSFVLNKLDGKKLLLKRLSMAALDSINYFINTALEWNNKIVSDLSSFLDFIVNGDIEIKREGQGNKQNGVKILTVHGAKGLEGQYVFLADTCKVKSNKAEDKFIFDEELFFWFVNKSFVNEQIENSLAHQSEKDMEEYKRLLYVALTRAKRNLYIFGLEKCEKNSWYEILRDTFNSLDKKKIESVPEYLAEYYEEDAKILSVENIVEEVSEIIEEKIEKKKESNFNYPQEPEIETPVLKNDVELDKNEESIRIGNIIHKIMQNVSQIPEDIRLDWVSEKIENSDLNDNQKEDFNNSLKTILDDYPWMFENNRPEQEVIVKGKNGTQVYRIDNLIINEDEVIIIDYKTDRKASLELFELYKKQLKNYKLAIGDIYKDRAIKTYILWLLDASLQEII